MAQRDANRIASLSVQNGTAQPVYPVEEAVLGGMVADRVVSAATRWIGSLDVALAGKVGASNGGNISAQQITREGIPARLSTAEQGTLTTIDTLPDTALQGAAREYVANSYFTRNGFTPLEGKCGSGNCFDGVYIKGDKVYVNEVKPLNANGSIKLSGPSGNMVTQMTDAWISSAIKRLEESGNAQANATAAIVKSALDNQTLVRVVTGVNSNGMTIVKLK